LSHFKLVPDEFAVPTRVETDEFVVVPLIMDRFAIDFESYATSVKHLQDTFSVDMENSDSKERWPAGATIRMALIDAAYCEMAFHLRTEFAYEILDRSETRQLGCVYVWPTTRKGYEAEARMWVRADEFDRGFDDVLYTWFRGWVADSWPFSTVAWPGREIPWNEWSDLPLKER
jgi:hypothetical protein